MAWKSWPYWVRGGVIGLFIGIIALIYGLACGLSEGSNIRCMLIVYPILYFIRSILPESLLLALGRFTYLITVFGTYIILSAIIGLIIGKFKKKKNADINKGVNNVNVVKKEEDINKADNNGKTNNVNEVDSNNQINNTNEVEKK